MAWAGSPCIHDHKALINFHGDLAAVLALGDDTSDKQKLPAAGAVGSQAVAARSETIDSRLYLPLSSEPRLAARKSIATACCPYPANR